MILELPRELEVRLAERARRQGVSVEAFAVRALEEAALEVPSFRSTQRSAEERRQRAIAMLQRFRQGDPQEQKETLEFLMRAIDEDRPGQRKHFSE